MGTDAFDVSPFRFYLKTRLRHKLLSLGTRCASGPRGAVMGGTTCPPLWAAGQIFPPRGSLSRPHSVHSREKPFPCTVDGREGWKAVCAKGRVTQGGEAPGLPQEDGVGTRSCRGLEGTVLPTCSGCTFWEQKWRGRRGAWDGVTSTVGECVAVCERMGALPISVWVPGFWIPAACPS